MVDLYAMCNQLPVLCLAQGVSGEWVSTMTIFRLCDREPDVGNDYLSCSLNEYRMLRG